MEQVWWQEKLPECSYSPETILESEDPNEPLHIKLCPVAHTGYDKDGCPVYWERSGHISGFFSQVADQLQTAGMVARHIRTQVGVSMFIRIWHINSVKVVQYKIILFYFTLGFCDKVI